MIRWQWRRIAQLAGMCVLLGVGGGEALGADWQWSVAPLVQLGVRDKYGELINYEATFFVTDGVNVWWRKTKVDGTE